MLNFLIDNIFVVFGGKVFKYTIGIPICTNCATCYPISFCIHASEAEFIHRLHENKNKSNWQPALILHSGIKTMYCLCRMMHSTTIFMPFIHLKFKFRRLQSHPRLVPISIYYFQCQTEYCQPNYTTIAMISIFAL